MPKITEPMTMVTDYLLALFAWIFAYFILANGYDEVQLYWSLSLIVTGIGAVGGGSSHGFKEFFSEKINSVLWKTSIIPIGIGAYLMGVASINSSLDWQYRWTINLLLAFTTLLYCIWIAFVNDKFIYVIFYYAPLMLLVLALQVLRYLLSHLGGYIILGVLVSFLAAGIQITTKEKLPKYFNNNDLFHVMQIIGLYLFYLGADLSYLL